MTFKFQTRTRRETEEASRREDERSTGDRPQAGSTAPCQPLIDKMMLGRGRSFGTYVRLRSELSVSRCQREVSCSRNCINRGAKGISFTTWAVGEMHVRSAVQSRVLCGHNRGSEF